MEIATGILLTATVISAVKNLYELTFMIDDDPVKQKRFKYQTTNFNRDGKTRQYFLTIEGNRIVDVQPIC